MGQTTKYQIPYPEPADPADVPGDLRELADAVDPLLGKHAAIFDQQLSADTGTISITAIPQTYKHLRLLVVARGTLAASVDELGLRFNGDAGAVYDSQLSQASGTTVVALTNLANGLLAIGVIAAGTATPATQFGSVTIDIPDYTGPNRKTASAVSAVRWDDDTGLAVRQSAGFWRSTAAITRIDVFAIGSASLKAGSRVTLYGTS